MNWLLRLFGYRRIRANDKDTRFVRVHIDGQDVTDYTMSCLVPLTAGVERLGMVRMIGVDRSHRPVSNIVGRLSSRVYWGRVKWE